MDSLEDEGVVVKSPSFDSSDEEVTVRKKIVVIESDGAHRYNLLSERYVKVNFRRQFGQFYLLKIGKSGITSVPGSAQG